MGAPRRPHRNDETGRAPEKEPVLRLRPVRRRLEPHPQRQLVSPRIGDQHLGVAVGRFRIELVGGIADAKAHLGGLAVRVVGRQVQGGVGRQLQGARAVTQLWGRE